MARTVKPAPAPERVVISGVTYVREDVATAATAAASEASAHYVAKDLPCTAAKPCVKTFRTQSGLDWHVANVKHA